MPSMKPTPERAEAIIRRLKKEFPESATALHHDSALELLIATILSAQCTDERVNKVTGPLFKKYRSASDFAKADRSILEQEIKSTGFFRAKTNSIIKCCQMLVEKFNGTVPQTIDELTQLAGVGRKTANVVLGNHFGIVSGIVVDTHVKRLSGRLGLTKQTDPEKIEADLMALLPKKYWIDTGNLLILHGRKTCDARKPKCPSCSVKDLCPSAGKVP
jgi:endonuclease-3